VNGGASAADRLSRFVFEQAPIRGAVVSLDAVCREILACHPYPPALRRALAELLAASTLLASTLKFAGTLTVQLQGNGAVRLLVVECDARLALRATAQWTDDAATLPRDASLCELAGGAEHGRLAITLDPRDGGPIYQGIVALEAVSIATLIEHYLATSEQIASRILLTTSDDRVRGLLLQRLPGATAADPASWHAATRRLDALPAGALPDAGAVAALLQSLFPEDDLRLFAAQPAHFRCRCSTERVANALRLIGRAEVESIVDEQGAVAIHCEFCNRRYAFDADAARALFGPRTGSAPPARH
jgi:molecular chaperone Hsp33